LAAFASGHAANTQNDPGAGGAVPGPLVSELRLGGAWGTGLRQPRVLALGYEVGRL
jgi:hypothetical protein